MLSAKSDRMRLSSARARTPSGGKLEGSVVTEQVSVMA